MKLSDFIADQLANRGIRHVFMLTGGGAMHLNDSLGKHPKLQVIFNHHEQACAMAAESYARLTHQMAVVNVTTGPGGLNAFNGVFGAWTDSIPMLVISGQVSYQTTVASTSMRLRQLGDQECNIIESVKPFTKYAVMVTHPNQISYHLHKAIYLATHGRPGPVWIDIPIDIQGATLQIACLETFDPQSKHEQSELSAKILCTPKLKNKPFQRALEKLKHAQRPVILAGNGIRIAKAHKLFLQLIHQLKIPVTTAWNAHDLLANDNKYYIGRPGSIGDRAGNFAVQNADLLLVLGSRLNIRQIGYNWKTFARAAYKIMVDIDIFELIKPTLQINLALHCHLKDFLKKLNDTMNKESIPEKKEWLHWCKERQRKYPVVLDTYWTLKTKINPYCFMQVLSEKLGENQIIVTGNGTACVTAFQAMILKKGQRLYTNSGCASMGYDLPAAIGACIGSGRKKIICITGDGSIQQNLQELATIVFNQYPIKLFILNNGGYHSIRQTQNNFFGKELVGCGPDSGLGFPDLQKIAYAYNITYFNCHTHETMYSAIENTLQSDAPTICEVFLTQKQNFSPKLASKKLPNGKIVSSSLEDLSPFLSKEELSENMIIDRVSETETA
jgi:acetolactate synthase-1/2/3 large subunit